jgi:U32 family peptidase
MELVSYLSCLEDLEKIENDSFKEIIVPVEGFSRLPKFSLKELESLTIELKRKKITPIIEWDVLMTENQFRKRCLEFETYFQDDIFSLVKVVDLGALEFVRAAYPQKKIQLAFPTGGHNYLTLKKIEDRLGDRLHRFILSNEWSQKELEMLCENLKTPLEVLLFGHLPLLYTPRKLLSALNIAPEANKPNMIKANAHSEESVHKDFLTIENTIGTQFLHSKYFCWLEMIPALKKMKMHKVRIDLRENMTHLGELMDFIRPIVDGIVPFDKEIIKDFIKQNNYSISRGFFYVNKTDVLFPKLKNYRLQDRGESFVGEVVDVISKRALGVLVKTKRNIAIGQRLKLATPDGKNKLVTLTQMTNTSGGKVTSASEGDVIYMPFCGGVSVKTFLYFGESDEG